MQNPIYLTVLMLVPILAWPQQDTEVYLFDLAQPGGMITLSNPQNISQNTGYDNQPAFMRNGHLLYATYRDGQTDVVCYEPLAGNKRYLTATTASEYSPTEMPEDGLFSCIVLEEDGRQLLWKYPLQDPGSGEVLIPYLKIGYHAWLDPNRLFAFVLGPHHTLQEVDLKSQRAEIVVEDIGRSLHRIPGTETLSYIDKSTDNWMIMAYNPEEDSSMVITHALAGVEDMCWYDQATLLMGKDQKLFQWRTADGWQELADLGQWGLKGISRLAVSHDRSRLAVVVAE